MSIFEIGRIAVKIAGRDSGNHCVIIDVLDEKYVMIDGNVRRKKCNINHLEPLKEVLKIKKNETHENVIKAMKQAGIKIIEQKIRAKNKGLKIRPKKIKIKKAVEESKKAKKNEKRK